MRKHTLLLLHGRHEKGKQSNEALEFQRRHVETCRRKGIRDGLHAAKLNTRKRKLRITVYLLPCASLVTLAGLSELQLRHERTEQLTHKQAYTARGQPSLKHSRSGRLRTQIPSQPAKRRSDRPFPTVALTRRASSVQSLQQVAALDALAPARPAAAHANLHNITLSGRRALISSPMATHQALQRDPRKESPLSQRTAALPSVPRHARSRVTLHRAMLSSRPPALRLKAKQSQSHAAKYHRSRQLCAAMVQNRQNAVHKQEGLFGS